MCASSETIDLCTLEFGQASTRCPSTASKRATNLHIVVPAITRGTLARSHELKMYWPDQLSIVRSRFWGQTRRSLKAEVFSYVRRKSSADLCRPKVKVTSGIALAQPPPQALRFSHGRGERETRVTGDEPQGTMGRVPAFLCAHIEERRLGTRQALTRAIKTYRKPGTAQEKSLGPRGL